MGLVDGPPKERDTQVQSMLPAKRRGYFKIISRKLKYLVIYDDHSTHLSPKVIETALAEHVMN